MPCRLFFAVLSPQYLVSVAALYCQQVHCQTSVCAKDANDASVVASSGLEVIIGPDCGSFSPPPTNNGQGPCASGLSEYKGQFNVWRGWIADSKYTGSFAQWSNFLGAECSAAKSVKCEGGGKCPAAGGQCNANCP